jgi:multidrug resistance efflux pump
MKSKIIYSKYFNLIYIVAIIVAIGLWKYLSDYQDSPLIFYGFAETQETEINMDQPLEIIKVYVVPGQSVKQGDLIAEVRNAKTDRNIEALFNKIKALEIEEKNWLTNNISDYQVIEAEKNSDLNKISKQIESIEAEIDFKKELWKGLKYIKPDSSNSNFDPLEYRLSLLKSTYDSKEKEYDIMIRSKKELAKTQASPFRKEIDEIQSEINYYKLQSERYSITAPHDGLIGNVHCKEGEFEDAFETLISFYEENPTQVKGYVNENYILHVALNDTFLITSMKDQTLSYKGVLVGLGTRIVEIPSRMRKIPELRTYGREVVIEIPKDNELLQKEKVMLELIATSNKKNYMSRGQ